MGVFPVICREKSLLIEGDRDGLGVMGGQEAS
jgi:hypothetical protein